jgi:hypothetical protein
VADRLGPREQSLVFGAAFQSAGIPRAEVGRELSGRSDAVVEHGVVDVHAPDHVG